MRVSVRPLSNDKKFEARFQKSLSTPIALSDDLECQFCEALVKNVRNILITNTSESEFIQVLSALCKQTGTFAKEVYFFFILNLNISPGFHVFFSLYSVKD